MVYNIFLIQILYGPINQQQIHALNHTLVTLFKELFTFKVCTH